MREDVISLDEIDMGNKRLMWRIQGYVTERRLFICICIPGTSLQFIPIAVFAERANDVGETEYIIKPIWNNYVKYNLDYDWNGISGIDMVNRREEYVRDYMPPMPGKRIPPKGRDNTLYTKLTGIETDDAINLLIATKGICNDEYIFLPASGERQYYLYRNDRKYIEKYKLDISDLNTDQIFDLSEDEDILRVKHLYLD